MKLNFKLKAKFKYFCFILIFLLVLIFQPDIQNLKAITMDNYKGKIVVEELRIRVPASSRSAWLNA